MIQLTQAIIRLFHQERFYAELVLQMDRIVSDKVPTLGVCVKDVIQLHVNPKFFVSLSKDEQVAVLKHECQHIINDHISRAKEYAPDVYTSGDALDNAINNQKHQLINIAADCAINPGIPNVPKEGCFPQAFGLPNGMLMEWYIDKLRNNDKTKHLTEVHGHELWGESDGEKEEIKEKIRKAVKDAVEKTKEAGKMSHEIELLIDRLNYKPKDWRGDLKRFAARATETSLQSSKKKRNRRYGIMYPGVVKEEVLHIGVAMDTSGSISDEALCQFMAEIGNIAKFAKVTVVEADSEVKNAYEFDPKKKYKVAGRGGTAYQPAFDYFSNETDVDGVIYLGDMDCFDEKLTKPKYLVLWAIIGTQKPPADWGSKTHVQVTKK